MRTYVLDTGPLLELVVAAYQGPGRRALEGKLKLSKVHGRILSDTIVGTPFGKHTTAGVVSEVEHHADQLGVGQIEFNRFFLRWLLEQHVSVTNPNAATWDKECSARFGPTDGGVLALAKSLEEARKADVCSIVMDRALQGWARSKRMRVVTPEELTPPE